MYSSIIDNSTIDNKLFFSVFHSISAFCNAGFSILSAGIYDEGIRFNYYLQWILIIMIVLGGLGHNIVFNFYQKLKPMLLNGLIKQLFIKKYVLLL